MLTFKHNFAGQSHTVTVWEPGHPVLKCTGPICGVDSETTLIKNKYTWPDLVVAGFSCNREVHIVTWQYIRQYQEELFKVNPTTKFSFFNLAFDQTQQTLVQVM